MIPKDGNAVLVLDELDQYWCPPLIVNTGDETAALEKVRNVFILCQEERIEVLVFRFSEITLKGLDRTESIILSFPVTGTGRFRSRIRVTDDTCLCFDPRLDKWTETPFSPPKGRGAAHAPAG